MGKRVRTSRTKDTSPASDLELLSAKRTPLSDSIGPMVKIVYFDEQSASDYLDITAGGKLATSSEHVKKRARAFNAKVGAAVAAKFSWLPFVGGTVDLGGAMEVSRSGETLLSKTLSNTILTDYLAAANSDVRIVRLVGLQLEASEGSMTHLKMYTPYLVIMRTEGPGLDLAKMDEAFANAKGYYELFGATADGSGRCVLRFNISSFRNNYGLTDLAKMELVYHGIKVGRARLSDLTMQAEMSQGKKAGPLSARDLLDGPQVDDQFLEVFDVVLAGVERAA